MRKIRLTRGKWATIDSEDFGLLNKYKWYAMESGNTYYARSYNGGNQLYMHRVILGVLRGLQTDHINGDGLDNRRVNLRIATYNQNQMNRSKQENSSGFKGVSWDKSNNNWQVKLGFGGKTMWIGSFVDKVEAAKAYDVTAIKYFGEFAKLNFPQLKELK